MPDVDLKDIMVEGDFLRRIGDELVGDPATGPTGPPGPTGPAGPAGPDTLEAMVQPSLAPMARANKISRNASILRVGMVGMSIANFDMSLPHLGEKLRNEYGAPAVFRGVAGGLGGSYTASYNGWEKQPYGGRAYIRARGKAASTSNMKLEGFGDTVTLWFSVETDAEACNIMIDGVVVGTTPTAGAQRYAVKQTFPLARTVHFLEIVKPVGAGFCYLEEFEFLDTASTPGVVYHDWTLGGSSLGNSAVIRTPQAGQVTGIPIVGNAGIDGYFDNADIDLFVLMHDVNDAQTSVYANFLAMFNRALELTRTNVVPLVLVSSMAGHYINPADTAGGGHTTYFQIHDLYRDTATAESHVTHVDWHAATALTDYAKYQQTYYSGVTGYNPVTGAYTGDFIHPDANAYAALQHELAEAFVLEEGTGGTAPALINARTLTAGLRTSRATIPLQRDVYELIAENTQCVFNEVTDTFTTTLPHGLAVNDRVFFANGLGAVTPAWDWHIKWVLTVPSTTTFTISDTKGGAQWVSSGSGTTRAGTALIRLTPRQYLGAGEIGLMPRWCSAASAGLAGYDQIPVYFDPVADDCAGSVSISEFRTGIQSAPTGTDQYGKYKVYTANTNYTIRGGLHFDVPSYTLIRYAGAGLGFFAAASCYFVDYDGNTLPPRQIDGALRGTLPATDVGSPPITAVVGMRASATATTGLTISAGATTTARVYDIATSPSPTWPGMRVP